VAGAGEDGGSRESHLLCGRCGLRVYRSSRLDAAEPARSTLYLPVLPFPSCDAATATRTATLRGTAHSHECARYQTVASASARIAPSLVTSPVDSWNYYDVVAIVENQIDIALRARLAGPKVAAWCALVFRGRGHARCLVGRSAAVVTQASPSVAGGCNSGRYTRGQAWPVQVGGDDARQTAAVC
jgi:hypothetical protein